VFLRSSLFSLHDDDADGPLSVPSDFSVYQA